MAKIIKDRDLWQISTYLPPKVYERLRGWMESAGIKSESEAVLRCPRDVMFPGEYPDNETPLSGLVAKVGELEAKLEASMAAAHEAQAIAAATPKRQWLSTREAFDQLIELGAMPLSFDRFRRLDEHHLAKRFALLADPSRRIHGSNTSRWLYFEA